MEGRALRARAAYRSWPREHIEFALVRPIRCAANIAMANRVIHDVMPLLCVGFGSTQLPIPKVTLPNRKLSAMRPCPRDVISPVRDPLLQWLRRKRIWCAE
jgi:hypothetical protein